jgi:hypothetical protein
MKIRLLNTGPQRGYCDGCTRLRSITHIEYEGKRRVRLRWFCADCAGRLERGEEMTTFYRTHLPTGKTSTDERFFANDSKALEALGRWNDMGGKTWKYTLNPPPGPIERRTV